MLRQARALWRRSRDVPGLRALIAAADRAWWARIIRGADVVDLDHVRAQGFSGGPRQAVRSYVRGGFRRGLSLNPLFMERLVSSQLSDAGRVPALYAYLVNDARSIRTSVAWDSVGYAATEPDALRDRGGPLGHAWRSARRSGVMTLTAGGLDRSVTWNEVSDAASRAARWAAAPADAPSPRGLRRPLVFVCRVAADEPAAASALDAAAEVARRKDADVVLALDRGRVDSWTAAALLAVAHPAVSVTADRNVVDAVEAVTTAEVLLVRGRGADISAADLLTVAEAATDAPVAPLWLGEDGVIAATGIGIHNGRRFHLMAGHPSEDAAGLPPQLAVAEVAGGTYARPLAVPLDTDGRTLIAVTVRAPATPPDRSTAQRPDTDLAGLLEPLGMTVQRWTEGGPTLLRTRGQVVLDDGVSVPRLRWAIKTAAPAGPAGEAWGDTHFARGIADALRRLGQEVVIDAYAARRRRTAYLDDVIVALRGPEPIEAQSGAISLLWIISHPDQITSAEIAPFDVVFAGSGSWAAAATDRFGRQVDPLLQCTDVRRFHPQGLPRGGDLVFVGTARGIPRPSVLEPLRAGIPVAVYGPDWRGWIPASAIVAPGIPNVQLPAVYEAAGAVLNDHWPAMRANGFISNRLYDVVAAGGRAISDAVTGIDEIFSGAVRTYESIPQLIDLLGHDLGELFPTEVELGEISARIRREHSFDARARTLLDAALQPAGASLRTRSPAG